jgi:DNA-binding response OmpR family regulator
MPTQADETIDGGRCQVIFVEDDVDFRESLAEYLSLSGFTVTGVGSCIECYTALCTSWFDVAVVDLSLPDQSGLVLVEYLRANTDIRIIIMTAGDADDERVRGYTSGADLNLVKPVKCRELAAAVFSMASRRSDVKGGAAPTSASDAWVLAGCVWRLISPASVVIELTTKEMQFLEILGAAAGFVVSRETLLEGLYGRYDEHASRALYALVRRLRSKITAATGAPSPIRTARSAGLCFAARAVFQ